MGFFSKAEWLKGMSDLQYVFFFFCLIPGMKKLYVLAFFFGSHLSYTNWKYMIGLLFRTSLRISETAFRVAMIFQKSEKNYK